jgi:hypothetical protein
MNRTHPLNFTGGQPLQVEPPADLPVAALQTVMDGPDEKLGAMAGYLLALSGSKDGYHKLEAYWRAHGDEGGMWERLMWRAITVQNDDSLTPILEEIYGKLGAQNYFVREFYWTIRGIKGPQILKLRKRIRDEVGMERLQ